MIKVYKINMLVKDEIKPVKMVMLDDYNKLEDKINKAVKYINSKRYDWGDPESQDEEDYDIGYDEVTELLDILRGE